jgi:hypothetical protein
MVIWGGLTGKLLECAAEFSNLCEAISEVLDSMYTAEIPRANHMKDFLHKEMKKKFAPSADFRANPAILIPPSVNQRPLGWKNHACDNCVKTNIHTHSHTCKKPPSGFHGCRMAKPSGLSTRTMPIQLIRNIDGSEGHSTEEQQDRDNKILKGEERVPFVQERIDPRSLPSDRDMRKEPVPLPDERCIVWELKRPHIDALPDIVLGAVKDMQDEEDDQCMNDDGGDGTSNPLEAKAFCIGQIQSALLEGGHCSLDSIDNIIGWLTTTKPVEVITIYVRLGTELPQRNGLVTEFNDILINLLGSSVAVGPCCSKMVA